MGGRTASWPAAAPQSYSTGSPLKTGTRSFGLSSVISMSRSDALETTDDVSQEGTRESEASTQPEEPKKKGFGLSALLGGGGIAPKQMGGMGTAQLNKRTVT